MIDLEEICIMILRCKISKKVQAHISKCVRASVCLKCSCKATKRGLCTKHYDRWCYLRRSLSRNARYRFDKRLIEAGELLGPYEIIELKQTDSFAKAAKNAS